jgi:hypothetical protein
MQFCTHAHAVFLCPSGVPYSAVLEDTRRDVQGNVRRAAQGGDGWSRRQFAEVAVLVLDTKHNAVVESKVAAVIGAAALRALVKANVFSVRPYSRWALDVDEEAFVLSAAAGEETRLDDMIITAASPVYLFCMREQRKEFEAALQLTQVSETRQMLSNALAIAS